MRGSSGGGKDVADRYGLVGDTEAPVGDVFGVGPAAVEFDVDALRVLLEEDLEVVLGEGEVQVDDAGAGTRDHELHPGGVFVEVEALVGVVDVALVEGDSQCTAAGGQKKSPQQPELLRGWVAQKGASASGAWTEASSALAASNSSGLITSWSKS